MLDLTQGPIANIEQYVEAKEEERNWEEVELMRDEKEIMEANKKWMKKHF